MKKYSLTRYYCESLTGVFEAKNEQDAWKQFDDTDTEWLDEEYYGHVEDRDEIEEIHD